MLAEDATHEAVLRGLARRWCPGAEVVCAVRRGRTGETLRRQLYGALQRLFRVDECDCAVVLRDADKEKWNTAVDEDRSKLPPEHASLTICAAASRNIECWLSADIEDFCRETGADPGQVSAARKDDPKGIVQAALRDASSAGDKELYAFVSEFVAAGPKAAWLDHQPCFVAFFDGCREHAAGRGCAIPNERDARARAV